MDKQLMFAFLWALATIIVGLSAIAVADHIDNTRFEGTK